MKRKRFIKALGYYGVTRNVANRMAQITRERGGTYQDALEYFKIIYARICLAAMNDYTAAGYWAPYAGLMAANGAHDVGVDLSNGKDLTCFTPVTRYGATVCCMQPIYISKGVAGE